MTKSYRGKYLIAAIIVAYGLVVGLVLFILFSGSLTLSSRLVDTITDHVHDKGMFTANKLISSHEDTALNGDTGLNGMFQLTKTEIQQLWGAKQILICPPNRDCQTEDPIVISDVRCQNAIEYQDVYIQVCIYRKSNQVSWSYSIT